jgi:chorismate mutase
MEKRTTTPPINDAEQESKMIDGVKTMEKRTTTPPINDAEQESKMIDLAISQARNQLERETASSQIVTHFLRLGSLRAQVELEKLKLENNLLEEKITSERQGQQLNEMVQEVLKALNDYSYVPPGADDVDI